MKLSIVILLFYFLFVQNYHAQSYLGKKWGLRVGMKTNFGMQKKKHLTLYDFNSDKGQLIPKVVVGFQKEGRRNNMLIFESGYQDLANSKTYFYHVEQGNFIKTTNYDSILTKSRSFQLALCFRKFLELGSIGNYLELRMVNNFVFSKSQQINSVKTEYSDLNYYTYELHKRASSGMSQIPQLSVGLGNVYPLNKKMTLDVGFNFGIFFVKREFEDSEIQDPDVYQRVISSQKIFSSNRLEFNLTLTIF